MKLTLTTPLRKVLLAACALAYTAQAAEHTIGSNNALLFTAPAEDTVIVDISTGYFVDDTTTRTAEADIQVKNWNITNGHSTSTYTFNGSLVKHADAGEDGGNIQFNWSGARNQTWHFNGDLSGYTGDFLINGQVKLNFGGAAGTSISGTGDITVGGANPGTLIFNKQAGTSTITNGTINAQALQMNGGAGVIYEVSSQITATSFTAAAGTSIVMQAGSSLSVTNTAVNTDANITLNGGSLTLLNASSIGDLTLAGDSDLYLTLGLDTALSVGATDFTGASSIDIFASLEGELEAGREYVIFDAADSLTDASIFNVTLNALDASTYTTSINADGNLVVSLATSSFLTWTGGNGTWTEDADGWNTDAETGGAAIFNDGKFVTFDTADGATDVVSIAGTVTAGSIKVTGSGNLELVSDDTNAGIIAGDVQIVKDGTGTLTLATANTFTGGVALNAGTIIVDHDNALGTGNTTVASSATLVVKGVGHLDHMSYTLNSGATLELQGDGSDMSADSGIALAAGTTLSATGGGNLSVGGAVDAASITDRYERSSQGYTVRLEDDTTLTDNVRLQMTGSNTTITGEGVYEVHSVLLSATDDVNTTLTIDEGATLRVLSTVNDELANEGGFMLSNWPAGDNKVNVAGTLDLASGISDRDGSGTINIASTGSLIMRQGLTTHSGRGNKTINIDGGTLELHNQADTTNHANNGLIVNVDTGSTLKASGTANVYTSLNLDAAGTYTVAGDDLIYHNNVSVASVTIDSAASLSANSITVTNGTNTTTLTGKDGLKAQVSNNDITSNASLVAGASTGLSISDATITGDALSFTNTTLTNVVISSDVILGAGTVLDDVVLGSALTATQVANTSIPNSGGAELDALTFSIAGLENVTIKDSLTLSLGDLGTDFATALTSGEPFAFELAGVTESEFLTAYTNVTILFDEVAGQSSFTAVGYTVSAAGNIVLYIPEPSTATLSLMALAGLLARRRRRS